MKNLNLLITFVLLFVLTLNAKAVETNQATFDVWGGSRDYLDQKSLWDFDNYEEAVKDFFNIGTYGVFDFIGTYPVGSTQVFDQGYQYYVLASNDYIKVDYYGSWPESIWGTRWTGKYGEYYYTLSDPYLLTPDVNGQIDGQYKEMWPGNTDSNYNSVIIFFDDDSSTDFAIATCPNIDGLTTGPISIEGDSWLFRLAAIGQAGTYFAQQGECLIDNNTLYRNLTSNLEDSGIVSLDGSTVDENGWRTISNFINGYTDVFAENSTVMASFDSHSDQNNMSDMVLSIKKDYDATVNSVQGDYGIFGYWVDYAGSGDYEAEVAKGTIKVENATLSGQFTYHSIDGNESENVSGRPYTFDKDNALLMIENDEGQVQLHISQGGILLDLDTKEDYGCTILVKKSSNKKISDIAGKWLYQEFSTPELGTGQYVFKSIIEIDLDGNYIAEFTCHGCQETKYTDTGRITLSSNGDFVLRNSQNDEFEGTVNINNDIFLLSNFGNNDIVGLGMGIRSSIYPSAPTISLSLSGTLISVSWEAVSDANGYTLYYAPYPYTGPESIGSWDMGNQTSLSLNLWVRAHYLIAVQAYNDNGNSEFSNIELFAITSENL